jgi:DNA gyrase subunit A
MEVVDSDDMMIITDSGVMIRLPIAEIRSTGRATQGVRVIKLDEGANISSISKVLEEDDKADAGETDYPSDDEG